jgi:antitoxin YefM
LSNLGTLGRNVPRRIGIFNKTAKTSIRGVTGPNPIAVTPAGASDASRLDFQIRGRYPVQVESITYSAARENLASTINRVCDDQAPVVITRNRDQAVVMLSLAEYESLQETAYLLRSPANAKRLIAAVETLNRGKGKKRKLKG